MEPATHFDLDQSIAAWRAELATQHGLAPEDVRTLEAHLRDGIAELQRLGRTDAEAFAQARTQVGAPAKVAEEFAKAGNWRAWLMKRWVALTVLLYGLALLVLTIPLILVSFGNWAGHDGSVVDFQESLRVFNDWAYWLWIGVLVAGQALLLLLPLNIASRRLKARRPLKLPVVVAAFFLAVLSMAVLFCLLLVLYHDHGTDFFAWLDPLQSDTDNGSLRGMLSVMLLSWMIWTLVFYHFARKDEPAALLQRITRWLLRGSILELLVAVPSHVIVRRRDDCCAPVGTFWGITVGISVMLLCFGPGVFFLFVERCRRLKPRAPKNRVAQ
ncbi:MAG TPA: hypothetical protein VHC95_13555 [Opitutales bacterium]|nr:hypothetical protein [Opitutales bacterium]